MIRSTPEFQTAMDRLNPEQRRAVLLTEGPVMVNAGPGTGKTQILATRVGHILLTTDTAPSNILCLTFTDAGATAMRKRLLGLIGPEAHKVSIHTFHAFCGRVIQENPDRFDMREQEPVGELERLEIIHGIIDTFEADHPLKRYKRGKYADRTRLQNLFSTMKQEGWTPDHIAACCREYIDDLPNRADFVYKRKYKQFEAGDLKQAKVDKEVARMKTLVAAARCLPLYQQALADRGSYDFDDMILNVRDAFREHANLLQTYQEQFLYIMADEYQDTNGAQNDVLLALADFWHQPNLFVVGDDDQSIYRFQGANVANMTDFVQRYIADLPADDQAERIIVLRQNYRSTEPILRAAAHLIDRNHDRLVNRFEWLSKDLESNHTMPSESAPAVISYPTRHAESADIARRIIDLLDAGTSAHRIGVIYRNHAQSEDLIRFLRDRGVDVFIKRTADILQEPFTRSVLHLLRYFEQEMRMPLTGDHSLFHLLHTPFFRLRPLDLAALTVRLQRSGAYRARAFGGWREAILQHAADDERFAPIVRVVDRLDDLFRDAVVLPLQVFFDRLVRTSGLMDWMGDQEDRLLLMQELNTFFDFIKAETSRRKDLTVGGLLESIDWMVENTISLPVRRFLTDQSGVHFMTAHGAKGLQFQHVFVIGCEHSVWVGKRGGRGRFSMPDNLVRHTVPQDDGEQEEENRRLFYVALTRAEDRITLSHAERDGEKDIAEAEYLTDLLQAERATRVKTTVDADWMDAFRWAVLSSDERPDIPTVEKNMMASYLDDYRLSVTHMNNYLECPLKFYYQNFLRVPGARNEAMEYGSAMHWALQRFFEEMLDRDGTFPDTDEAIAWFEGGLRRRAEVFRPQDLDDYLETGRAALRDYLDRYRGELHTNVTLERRSQAVFDGIPLSGVFDKLEIRDRSINVVDYKTGKFSNARGSYRKFNRPGESVVKKTPAYVEEHGGDYWRQAVFYRILLAGDPAFSGLEVTSAEFDFIEPEDDEFHKQKVVITPDDIRLVQDQIQTVYTAIMNREFTGCGDDDCDWCAFENARQALPIVEDDEG